MKVLPVDRLGREVVVVRRIEAARPRDAREVQTRRAIDHVVHAIAAHDEILTFFEPGGGSNRTIVVNLKSPPRELATRLQSQRLHRADPRLHFVFELAVDHRRDDVVG